MSNTFIPLSNHGAAPLVAIGNSPRFGSFTSVNAPVSPVVSQAIIPIAPLPGITGAGSYAIEWLAALPFVALFLHLAATTVNS